jgi:hypothetical protein
MPRGKDRRLLSARPQEPTSASSASHNPAFDQASISNGMPFRTETFAAYINRSGSGCLVGPGVSVVVLQETCLAYSRG